LEVHSVRFVLFSILFFTLHVPQTHALLTSLSLIDMICDGHKSDVGVDSVFDVKATVFPCIIYCCLLCFTKCY